MSLDNLSIYLIVPAKWFARAETAIQTAGVGSTVEGYFQLLAGLLMEKIRLGMHYQLVYNQVSSTNGSYIFKMDVEGPTEDIVKFVSDQHVIRMLEIISPYCANKKMTFGPNNIFGITVGHEDGFETRFPAVQQPTVTPQPPLEPKQNVLDSYPSYMLLKLVVPPANMEAATKVVNEAGFSTIETYFDVLRRMIKHGCNNIYQNRLSAKNGAHVFVLEINAMYDDFYYVFDRYTINMIRRMSPYLNTDKFVVWTPRIVDNVLQYEYNDEHYIQVGRDVPFGYYMGAPCSDFEGMALEAAIEIE